MSILMLENICVSVFIIIKGVNWPNIIFEEKFLAFAPAVKLLLYIK